MINMIQAYKNDPNDVLRINHCGFAELIMI